MSRRKRYAAIGLAVAVVAGSATAAAALPQRVARGQVAAVAFLADHKPPKLPDYCLYPPQSTPEVDLDTNDKDRKVSKGGRVKLTAFVTYNECEIKDMPVALYKRDANDGATFVLIQSGTTDKHGKITFTSGKLRLKTSFYVVTPGGVRFGPKQSPTVTITVKN